MSYNRRERWNDPRASKASFLSSPHVFEVALECAARQTLQEKLDSKFPAQEAWAMCRQHKIPNEIYPLVSALTHCAKTLFTAYQSEAVNIVNDIYTPIPESPYVDAFRKTCDEVFSLQKSSRTKSMIRDCVYTGKHMAHKNWNYLSDVADVIVAVDNRMLEKLFQEKPNGPS